MAHLGEAVKSSSHLHLIPAVVAYTSYKSHKSDFGVIAMRLRGQQFEEMLKDPEGWGGYSANPHTGSQPDSGWMVSRFGHEEQVEGTADASKIDAYLERHGEHMMSPDVYHGAWQSEGKTFLDESVNVESRKEAMEMGRENAQRAVFNLDDMTDHVVPYERQQVKGTLLEGLPKTEKNKLGATHRENLRRQKELELTRQTYLPQNFGEKEGNVEKQERLF